MKIFFSVGEPSGDLHGANLIRELQTCQPDVQCIGYGGPRMADAGCALHADLTKLAVMWFARAVANLHTFWGLVGRADRYFRHQRPDAVVLIDYPGFNWWIARRAKVHGIPVFYYGVPQLWAWAGWRVKKMRRLVDHVLCKLPFEQAWYREQGCHATFVGHPYFDELRSRRRVPSAPGAPLVTILPGSRTQEVTSNLKWFLKAAEIIRDRVPNVRFAVASFNERQANLARQMVAQTDLPAEVCVGRTPELIDGATCCMAVSGSVSLELLYHAKPSVILYSISRPAHFAQSFFRKGKFITLVNLLAAGQKKGSGLFSAEGKRVLTPFSRAEAYDPHDPADADVPLPEYLTWEDKSAQLAEHVVEWLSDKEARQRRVEQLESLSAEVARGGASRRAAGYILRHLEGRPAELPKPHCDRFAA